MSEQGIDNTQNTEGLNDTEHLRDTAYPPETENPPDTETPVNTEAPADAKKPADAEPPAPAETSADAQAHEPVRDFSELPDGGEGLDTDAVRGTGVTRDTIMVRDTKALRNTGTARSTGTVRETGELRNTGMVRETGELRNTGTLQETGELHSTGTVWSSQTLSEMESVVNGQTGKAPDVPEDEDLEPEEESAQDTLEAPQRKRKKHRRKNWLLRIFIFCCIIAAVAVTVNLPYFEIQTVAVIGNQHVKDKEILKKSRIKKGDSILLLNPITIGSRIKRNYYISDVNLDRKFPNSVEIIVKEREPVAQFFMKAKSGRDVWVIIDRDGMVLKNARKQQNVTLVGDAAVTISTEGAKVQVNDTGTYKKIMNLLEVTAAGDLYFKKINISGSHVDAWIFDGLMCKGSYNNIIKCIESGELKAVVYSLYQQDVEQGTINIGDNNYCSFTP